jgi:hypothetical protein
MGQSRRGLAGPGLAAGNAGTTTDFECEGGCHFDLQVTFMLQRQFKYGDRSAQTIYFDGKM